jgi:hypothetical protein
MTRRKYAAGLGVVACLLTSTTAFAADATRSNSAVLAPAAQIAPTQGIRSATPLEKKKKSNALSRNAAIVAGIVGAVAVGTAIVVATDDDDEPDSAG